MAVLTLPPDEEECLRRHYAGARVILEYGSGGSTLVGASAPGRLVLSVESDPDWAMSLQADIDAAKLPSPALVWHVDIGPTGAWGRPVDGTAWQRFHRYALSIWDQAFFRHPDVVLIDGRFRAACFAAVCLRIAQPVTVLFDDYGERENYHKVEVLARPDEMAGRMAVFRLSPGAVPRERLTDILGMFADVSYAVSGAGVRTDYSSRGSRRWA